MAHIPRKKKIRDMDDLRKEIERELGDPLMDAEWNFLVKKEYIGEYLIDRTGRITISSIVKEVREFRGVFRGSEKPTMEKEFIRSDLDVRDSTEQIEAVSILIAQEAAENPAVKRFRSEVLSDKLLPWETMEQWLHQRFMEVSRLTSWLKDVPIPDTDVGRIQSFMQMRSPEPLLLTLELPPIQLVGNISLGIRKLEFPKTDGQVLTIPTALGSIPDRLRQLSEQLAKKYKWSNAQATAFILTGRIPLIVSLVITVKQNSRALFSRIVLEVDPVLSPNEVAKAYRRKRQEIMPAQHRNLSKRHIQLALFNAEQPKGKTWAAKMAEWNKTQPLEWAYKEVWNFSHDSREARRHLLRLEKEYNNEGKYTIEGIGDVMQFELRKTSEG